jgi:hypothetical protein
MGLLRSDAANGPRFCQMRKCETKSLSRVLYALETWSLVLRNEHQLGVTEKMTQRMSCILIIKFMYSYSVLYILYSALYILFSSCQLAFSGYPD